LSGGVRAATIALGAEAGSPRQRYVPIPTGW
jgi:hypothetical protein